MSDNKLIEGIDNVTLEESSTIEVLFIYIYVIFLNIFFYLQRYKLWYTYSPLLPLEMKDHPMDL